MKNMTLDKSGTVVHHTQDGIVLCTKEKHGENYVRTRKPANCEKCKELAHKLRNPN